ncbi:suppressor of fused domain protein [Streptomyces sp. 4F14]|uniref:suppressor of fused domain protein n=1 Tax=Streptomyces sp. 4F14 TaxID=3394380 RepID=UPI003A88F6B1
MSEAVEAHARDERFVELVTMLAVYHRTGHPLDAGHSLPVTPEEIAYRREHGTEALEQLFDDHALLPTDPHRESVV